MDTKQNITDAICKMQHGDTLNLNMSEDTCNTVKYYNLKLVGYESLFDTCIRDTEDTLDANSINRFFEEYTKAYIQNSEILSQTVLATVGESAYKQMQEDNISWAVQPHNKVLTLSKSPQNTQTCNCI